MNWERISVPRRPLGVFSMGILVVVLAISASLLAANILYSIPEVLSLAILLFGLWVMVLAGLRASNPETYGHGTFNVLSGGVLIVALGGILLLYFRALLIEYLFPVLLLVVGILVAVAGIRAWRK